MSELTLDFTDASFDADPMKHYIIDPSDNLVFEMMADGTTLQAPCLIGERVRTSLTMTLLV